MMIRDSRFDRTRSAAGFTLVEVLVVISILAILISILLPVVSIIRKKAQGADTTNWIAQLSNAINNYYQDFKAYPGPMGNDEVQRTTYGTSTSFLGTFPSGFNMMTPAGYRTPTATANGQQKITMAENLVLGLLGGFKLDMSLAQPRLDYDPTLVGSGPNGLNPSNPKKYKPYIDAINLSWQTVGGLKTGEYFDEASVGTDPNNPVGADDSVIPEFVDRFADPMPILYLRAKRGASPTGNTKDNNPIVTRESSFVSRPGQYDVSQFIAYTDTPPNAYPIGVGKKPPTYVMNGSVSEQPNPSYSDNDLGKRGHGLRTVNTNTSLINDTAGNKAYLYPYDAFAYLRNPALSGSIDSGNYGTQVPREKDKFILISAGPDRVYGTNDDLTSAGSITP